MFSYHFWVSFSFRMVCIGGWKTSLYSLGFGASVGPNPQSPKHPTTLIVPPLELVFLTLCLLKHFASWWKSLSTLNNVVKTLSHSCRNFPLNLSFGFFLHKIILTRSRAVQLTIFHIGSFVFPSRDIYCVSISDSIWGFPQNSTCDMLAFKLVYHFCKPDSKLGWYSTSGTVVFQLNRQLKTST